MTTTPRIATLSRTKRIASTAAWSASSLSPRPIQRAAAIAAASVTRTSSIAMLRSGACRAATRPDPKGRGQVGELHPSSFTSERDRRSPELSLHPVRRVDPYEIEAARDDGPRRAAEAQPERFLLALEHTMLVVEAVEVVGDPDRIGRNSLRAALDERVLGDRGQLGEPLHELPLLRRQRLG